MNKSKLLIFALALLPIGNIAAEEVDTLKIVDVEEVLIIAAPKENRKLRELPMPSPYFRNKTCKLHK